MSVVYAKPEVVIFIHYIKSPTSSIQERTFVLLPPSIQGLILTQGTIKFSLFVSTLIQNDPNHKMINRTPCIPT